MQWFSPVVVSGRAMPSLTERIKIALEDGRLDDEHHFCDGDGGFIGVGGLAENRDELL